MAEPYCLAMVLCDGVHCDPATGKHTLLGTFSTVGAPEFPAPVKFCIYFAITDLIGDLELTFRLVNSASIADENAEPVFQIPLTVQSPSPLAVCEGTVSIGSLTGLGD